MPFPDGVEHGAVGRPFLLVALIKAWGGTPARAVVVSLLMARYCALTQIPTPKPYLLRGVMLQNSVRDALCHIAISFPGSPRHSYRLTCAIASSHMGH